MKCRPINRYETAISVLARQDPVSAELELLNVVSECGIVGAAHRLCVSRLTVYRIMRKLGISQGKWRRAWSARFEKPEWVNQSAIELQGINGTNY